MGFSFVTLAEVLTLFAYMATTCSAEDAKSKYSSFQCIGGSQYMDTETMRQAAMTKFPLNDPEHRTCLFRNVCVDGGKLQFYISPERAATLPKEYQIDGFNGKMFHIGHLREYTLSMETVKSAVPTDIPFSHSKITFLDANSWSFNYGHYLLDNVLAAFTAATTFNIPFHGTEQLFETNCARFSVLDDAFTNRLVTYNKSMGSYKQACLEKLDGMHQYFFDYRPMYIDKLGSNKFCFDKLMVGQGSTFGLKSIDLSRGAVMRQFRDFVVKRIGKRKGLYPPPQEDIILVGLRTPGAAGGALIDDLCGHVTKALSTLSDAYSSKFKVECIVPSTMSFEDEIFHAQKAKLIVTLHGTISYLAMFARDGTQQLSIANPKELKENQMLLYATHIETLYLTWDKLEQLSAVLEHSLFLSEQYHANPY